MREIYGKHRIKLTEDKYGRYGSVMGGKGTLRKGMKVKYRVEVSRRSI